jgi:hypothetical protein
MEEDYNRFRFRNRKLYNRYSEKTVRFTFEQVSFFLEYHEDGGFSNRELTESINLAAKSAGIMIPDETELIEAVTDFFCDKLGLNRSFRNNYSVIYEIVSRVVSPHISSNKFIDPLTSAIIDEFDNSDYSTTMEEITFRLKLKPELRFISSGLLSSAVNSVYDYFTGIDTEYFNNSD